MYAVLAEENTNGKQVGSNFSISTENIYIEADHGAARRIVHTAPYRRMPPYRPQDFPLGPLLPEEILGAPSCD
jgi:hypothetical protein